MNQELIALLQPEGIFDLDWQEAQEYIDQSQILLQEEFQQRFLAHAGKALLFLGFSDPSVSLSESVSYLRMISAAFINALSKNPELESLKEQLTVEIEATEIERLLLSAPYLNGATYLNKDWIITAWENLNQSFSQELGAYQGSAAEFIASYNPNVHLAGRVFFHLVESKNDDYPFAFLATYATYQADKSKHLPLKNALIEYGQDSKKLLDLLATVTKASEKSAFVSGLIESGEIFHPLKLAAGDAYTVLKEIPLYEAAGILCRIPNWWKNKSDSLKIAVSVGNKAPAYLSFDALTDFNVEISLGGESISFNEAQQLLSEAEGLALIKGKWVEVDRDKLKETLKAYEQARKLMTEGGMSMIEAMRFQLNPHKLLNVPTETYELEINNGTWLNSVVAKLTIPKQLNR